MCGEYYANDINQTIKSKRPHWTKATPKNGKSKEPDRITGHVRQAKELTWHNQEAFVSAIMLPYGWPVCCFVQQSALQALQA